MNEPVEELIVHNNADNTQYTYGFILRVIGRPHHTVRIYSFTACGCFHPRQVVDLERPDWSGTCNELRQMTIHGVSFLTNRQMDTSHPRALDNLVRLAQHKFCQIHLNNPECFQLSDHSVSDVSPLLSDSTS